MSKTEELDYCDYYARELEYLRKMEKFLLNDFKSSF